MAAKMVFGSTRVESVGAEGILTLEEQHHAATTATAFGVGGEIFQDIVPNHLLNLSILGIIGRDDFLRVSRHQLSAGGKHPGAHQLKAGAGDETGEDTASAGFVQGVRRDDDVGKFLGQRDETTINRPGWAAPQEVPAAWPCRRES